MLRLFTKRCLTTTVALRANKPPVLDWMQQAELDAAKASKGRKLQESGSEFWYMVYVLVVVLLHCST